jgi:phosphatidate phosphatase LPIN
MAGYHSRKPTDEDDEDTEAQLHEMDQFGVSKSDLPQKSRSTDNSSDEADDQKSLRATSEPPELRSQSPPEYSWDWGNFPIKSPQKSTFPAHPLLGNQSRPASAPLGIETPSEPSTYDVLSDGEAEQARAIASDGKLRADREEDTRFWAELDGRRFSFELSTCGALNGLDLSQNASVFDQHRVQFDAFMNDEKLVNNPNLILRWDGKYISRQEIPPLFSAIQGWRKATLSRPGVSPVSDESILTAEPDKILVGPTTHARQSSWARWFTRSRTQPPETFRQDRISESSETTVRPPLQPAASEPVQLPDWSLGTSPPKQETLPPRPSSPTELKKHYAKTLRLTSDQLKSLKLSKGSNTITFSLTSGSIACSARIFVWDSSDHIVISDIDGTITKSDALGHFYTMIGRDWTHLGVAKLYTDICMNGYKIMYLTSRAIGQADSTRLYLKGIKQSNYQLPEGPVVMSPDRLMASLHREVIMRKPEVFKMACLRDIQRLFGPSGATPFYAGFGNRITDAMSYRSVNIPSSRIFTIDSSGEVKMELLELAGYKSSYIHMTDLVDQMFPPISSNFSTEYTDFKYWRDPLPEVQLPDLSPPSPALSARSDSSGTSALSRLRNFRLRTSTSPPPQSRSNDLEAQTQYDDRRDRHSHRSKSPLRGLALSAEDAEDHSYSRRRTTSIDSMPGSLPGSTDLHDFMQDEPDFSRDEEAQVGFEHGENEEGSEGNAEDEEQLEEEMEHIDDDLFEMDNIPFL